MRYAPRALLAGGLVLAASCLAACGGGAGLLSSDQSNDLNAAVQSLTSAVQSGNCAAAANAAVSLRNEGQNLPVSVNPSLKANLNAGVQKASAYAQTACHSSTTSTTSSSSSTKTTDTTTSTPTTTTTSSSSSTTTPTTTTSTITTTSTATTGSGSGTSSNGSGGAGLGGGGNGAAGAGGGGGNGQ